MNRSGKLLRMVGWILGLGVGGLLVVLTCGMFAKTGGLLLIFRLLAGFYFFLRENLPAITYDAGTFGPGVAAFGIATLMLHRLCAKWAVRTARPWSFGTSLCLALIVPVLFVISFIVPGVLLQWEMLRQVPWLDMN